MKKLKAPACVLVLILGLILPGLFGGLRVVRYTVKAGLGAPLRLALISDLHSCAYGEGQRELLDAIDREKPDFVLLGGDIFDRGLPDERAVTFLQAVGRAYPCYYVTGNHEYLSGPEAFSGRMAALEKAGVTRLSGEAVRITTPDGAAVTLCGADDPSAWQTVAGFTERPEGSFDQQIAALGEESAKDGFTILLTHRPERFELYSRCGFDLVLAGHAHGGQWRVPGLINGLIAPNQGLFPRWAGGEYEDGGTTMIVSRGLARESTPIPRLYNRPELVIVDLTA